MRKRICVGLWLVSGTGFANVVGGDLQNFNAVPGGIDYVTVQSSETLEPGYVNFSFIANHAVNILPYYEEDSSQQNRTRYNDSLTMIDFGAGIGLTESLEAGFAAQDLVNQEASGGSHGEFETKGVINYRFYGKWQFAGDADTGAALVVSGVFNNVENNPYVGKGGSPVTIVELAGDTTLSKIAVAVNLGYRSRKKGEALETSRIQPLGDEYVGSVGTSYLLESLDTKLVVELFGARMAERERTGLSDRQPSSAEVVAGLKYDVTSTLAAHVGGGTEVIHGVSTPDWRAYAGVNWTIGPVVEKKKDPPAVIRTPSAPAEERQILESINFATGKDEVPDSAVPELQAVAAQMGSSVYERVYIEGHTDSVGSAESNLELSERRAQAVRKWFIANAGVDPAKAFAKGYGETQPIADNGNPQGRARNRRVEVRVIRPLPGM